MTDQPPTDAAPANDWPDWFDDAAQEVIRRGVNSRLLPTRAEGIHEIHEAVLEYLETAKTEQHVNRWMFAMAYCVASFVIQHAGPDSFAAPDPEDLSEDQMVGLEFFDAKTGLPIGDPDDDAAGDPWAMGYIAAVRFVNATRLADTATAMALFVAAFDNRTIGPLLDNLVDLAGIAAVEYSRAHGLLTPSMVERLAVREIDEPPAAPTPPVEVIDGVAYRSISHEFNPDEEQAMAPGGPVPALYALGVYVPNMDHRGEVVENVHRLMAVRALAHPDLLAGEKDATLCGVLHNEDIAVRDLPEAMRDQARRSLREAERQAGATVALFRVWQHLGACEPAEDTVGGACSD